MGTNQDTSPKPLGEASLGKPECFRARLEERWSPNAGKSGAELKGNVVILSQLPELQRLCAKDSVPVQHVTCGTHRHRVSRPGLGEALKNEGKL